MVGVGGPFVARDGTMFSHSGAAIDAEHRCTGSRFHEMDSIMDSISCSEPLNMRQLRINLRSRTDDMFISFAMHDSSMKTMPLGFIDRHGEVSDPSLCC